MDKICVARDEECGVYGFVFFRDGEWISTIVDDNLCLIESDFNAYSSVYDPSGKKAKKWKDHRQTGSEALFYAKCEDSNETWLPLLEKAYAKVHGDYESIEGGWPGEGVEDLSGGIATTINLNRILSKEKLWQELLRANKDFIFTIATPGAQGGDSDARNGLTSQHAYTVLEAVEHQDENGKSVRFVRIRNPWGVRDYRGKGEWDGAWSDGSKEWTQYWMEKLKHKFGDDGVFWISFEDMLKRFDLLDRVRLFNGDDWYNSQVWTSVNVPWMATYLDDFKFVVDITQPGVFVFALSQLDERYYKGLEGQYTFDLHFLLRESGSDDHIALAGTELRSRSISAEVELEPGRYELIPKLVAYRHKDNSLVEEAVKKAAGSNPWKLQQIGLNYDRAHLKASQWKSSSGTAKDEKSIPIRESKAPEQVTKIQVVVKQASSTVPPSTEGNAAAESTDPATVQPDTKTKDEAKQEQQPSSITEESSSTGRGKQLLDLAAGPGGEGDKDPDPVEKKPKDEEKEDDDKAEAGPWNAVCVIGLRVFSKDANLGLHLEES
ncbi:hypothetical protein INS49_014794 [Diaporthe citri]|uniref:uncharacterized protein n=1 Tax=Diaporthe citri TaxID=83186 RepID=UPI001C7E35C3|nr:uncharacterized protein INS49_014794 [Diaporthe citri]KAG6356919.1 hypothetical protein INS49_014794 [Diaporthe citri]